MDCACGHTFFDLQCTHAILGKITKKRNMSNPTTISRMVSTRNEKFKISAGIIAAIGMTRLAMYRLLGQNRPLPRFGKSFMLPSFASLLDTIFKPEIHRELSSL